MADEEKSPLSKLWPNKGIDWTIMLVMAIALLCGALFSGVAGGVLAWALGQSDLAPGWKAIAGVVGYGAALALGILVGRKLDAKKRAHKPPLPPAGEASSKSPLPPAGEASSKSPLPPAGEG